MTVRSRTVAPRRSIPKLLAARISRGLLLASAVFSLSALLGSCLNGTEACEGSTTRVCTLLEKQCAGTTGCKPIAPHCASLCETHAQDECHGACVWKEGICRAPCSGTTSESACIAEPAGCTWTGEQCVESCAANSSSDTCSSGLCHWQTCTGVAPGSCSSYSAEACPTALGCDLVRHGGL